MTVGSSLSSGRQAAGAGTVLAWSLYELGATSVAMNMLSLHLPLDMATRVERGNEKFSLVFGVSMLVVAILAPVLGRLGDVHGKRRFLVPFALSGVALCASIASPLPVAVVLGFFFLMNVSFQSAYVFYNALLPDVSDVSTQGRVSGYGVAAGYLGSLGGMLMVLPFVSGAVREKLPAFLSGLVSSLSVAEVPPGEAWVRVNAYLPTALLWLLAAAPLLFLARLPRVTAPAAASGESPFAGALRTLVSLPKTPAILWFLVSNLLYMDVIHTVQIQMSTYSRFAVGLADGQIQVLLLTATAVAVVGGLGYGLLCQAVSIRAATLVVLGNWVVVFVLALVVTDVRLFYVVGCLTGIGLGGIKVVSRLGLVALVPRERMTEFFGFFTLAGEAASMVGPVLWAATLWFFPDKSPTGYRAALATLFVVMILSVVTFLKVRFPPPEGARSAS